MNRARSLLNRLVHPDGDTAIKLLRKDVRRLTERLEQLEQSQRTAAELLHQANRTSSQLRLVSLLNRRQQAELERIPTLLD